MNEKKLVEQMKRGNHQAMEEWICYYYPRVYEFLYYKCRNDALTKDLCQEVFIAFIRDLPTYQFQEKSLNFLYRVASHRYYDVLRKQKRMPVLQFDEAYDYDPSSQNDNLMLQQFERVYLERLIGDLIPPYLQDIIILHYFEGWTLKEIAQEMDKAQGDYYFDSIYPNQKLEYAITHSFNFFMLLMLAYIFCSIFSVERQRQMNQLILSSKCGQKVYHAKLLAGFIVTIGLCLVTMVGIFLMSYIFLPVRDFGLKGIDGISSEYFLRLIFSYGIVTLVEIITIGMDYIIVVFLSMGLSYLTKNNMLSFAAVVLMVVAPIFIFSSGTHPLVEKLMPGITASGAEVTGGIEDLVAINGKLYFSVVFVWLIYLIFVVAIVLGIHADVKKHRV